MGCYYGNLYVGSLAHADDVLLSLTLGSMKEMLNICEQYSADCNIIFNASKTKLMVFNIPNFSVLRRKLVYSMYKRVLASSNSLVRTLLDSNFFVTSRIFKQWMQILFSNYVC